MESKLTFDRLVEFLKEHHGELFKLADIFSSGALLVSGFAFGPGAIGISETVGKLSDILGVKDKFSDLGKQLLSAVGSRTEQGTLPRLLQLQVAYSLLCYTAFFEGVEQLLPILSPYINLQDSERHWLATCAHSALKMRATALERAPDDEQSELVKQVLPKMELELPHPALGYGGQRQQLHELYVEMTRGFVRLVESLALYEGADEARRREISEAAKALPEVALATFDAQYINLAMTFPEFWIWSNLHELHLTQAQIEKVDAEVREYALLSDMSRQQIDLGFQALDAAMSSIAAQLVTTPVDSALAALARIYKYAISEPVLPDTGATGADLNLIYPPREAIFVPQAFKVLRYNRGIRLENEVTWRGKDYPVRNDIGPFLLRYFKSPYSYTTPLIILGQPGSGKSLLTRMLAAQLKPYTCIRVELRNINAEQELYATIQEQIERTTQGLTISWPAIMERTIQRPTLVILDGYDELLQASGQVFANFLQRVANFQHRELEARGLPVRVIVTSRITLIDKAPVPEGSTIIRLLEFDERRKQRWVEVWNHTNQSYYAKREIEPFKIAITDRKISELTGQPLLLLMLAIYDSLEKGLRDATDLDRTELYNGMLRRFIRRERRKDSNLDDEVIEQLINRDMLLLGVTALGMHNRSKVSITSEQLNRDLTFFNDLLEIDAIPVVQQSKVSTIGGRRLEAADKILGSFFFMQDAQSISITGDQVNAAVEKAYEFLHKTFGEFLTADFFLQSMLKVVRSLHRLRQDNDLAELRDKLNDVGSPRKTWFSALSFVPLYTAPEALAMLREWLPHRLRSEKLEEKDFFFEFDAILYAQIGHMLNGTDFPPIFNGGSGTLPYESLPLLGHIATYTLNLIIIRAWLAENEYVFDEKAIPGASIQMVRPWDRLVHIWQAWLPADGLTQLAPLLSAMRNVENPNAIIVRSSPPRSFTQSYNNGDRLLQILTISDAIGDSSTGTLAELNLLGTYGILPSEDLIRRLEVQDIIPDIGTLFRVVSMVSYNPELSPELISAFARLISRRSAPANHIGMINTLLSQIRELIGQLTPTAQSELLDLINQNLRPVRNRGETRIAIDALLRFVGTAPLIRSFPISVRRSLITRGVQSNSDANLILRQIYNRTRLMRTEFSRLEEDTFSVTDLKHFIDRLPLEQVIEFVKLARLSRPFSPAINIEITKMCYERLRHNVRHLGAQRIDAWEDISWLARTVGDEELFQEIERAVGIRHFLRGRGARSRPTAPSPLVEADRAPTKSESGKEENSDKTPFRPDINET